MGLRWREDVGEVEELIFCCGEHEEEEDEEEEAPAGAKTIVAEEEPAECWLRLGGDERGESSVGVRG